MIIKPNSLLVQRKDRKIHRLLRRWIVEVPPTLDSQIQTNLLQECNVLIRVKLKFRLQLLRFHFLLQLRLFRRGLQLCACRSVSAGAQALTTKAAAQATKDLRLSPKALTINLLRTLRYHVFIVCRDAVVLNDELRHNWMLH